MAKPDPELLDPARYPFHYAMVTRFGDLDVNMHVNNVALVGILEDARVRFHHASGFSRALADHDGIDRMTTMVASLTIEYLGQAYYPQPLDAHIAVSRVGRTSYGVQQLFRQDDRAICLAHSVIVCVAGSKPAPLPASFTAGIAEWMLRP